MRTLTTTFLLASFIVSSLALGGCDDEDYSACAYAVDYNPECDTPVGNEEDDTQQGINCVITGHPHCYDGICIRYQGSSPFCSMACLTHDDCPDNGVCEEFAKGCDGNGENCNHYCVKGGLFQ